MFSPPITPQFNDNFSGFHPKNLRKIKNFKKILSLKKENAELKESNENEIDLKDNYKIKAETL